MKEMKLKNRRTGSNELAATVRNVTPEVESLQMTPDGPYPLLKRARRDRRAADSAMGWLTEEHPELERWRDLAHRWLSSVAHEWELAQAAKDRDPSSIRTYRVVAKKIISLTSFLVDYLLNERYPQRATFVKNPDELLRAGSHAADDFWAECCLPLMRNRTSSEKLLRSAAAETRSKDIDAFLTWVIQSEHPATDAHGNKLDNPSYRCPFPARTACGTRVGKVRKHIDMDLAWVTHEYPQLEKWRVLAANWIKQEKGGITTKLNAFSKFFGVYLAQGKLVEEKIARDPLIFLLRESKVADNYKTIVTAKLTTEHDYIVTFLDWVLLQECSERDDYGYPVLSEKHRNPFSRMGKSKGGKTGESVRSPLPYGYIDELRRWLVQGPNFTDWTWAHTALETGWFPVAEHLIDKSDPDCVWRLRTIQKGSRAHKATTITEMWSPVRWMALLVKLTLPLRTLQVRVLDSGEADTWCYDGSLTTAIQTSAPWKQNQVNVALREAVARQNEAEQPGHQLASKPARTRRSVSEVAHGVLRRQVEHIFEEGGLKLRETTVLHINTNKTADRNKEGAAKGFDIPWPILPWPKNADVYSDLEGTGAPLESSLDRYREKGELARNIHYWLQKLRDWQTKYNPVHTTTSWSELVRHGIVQAKSEEQIESYAEAVFLFREPAYPGVQRGGKPRSLAHLPLSNGAVTFAWWTMLRDFQFSLASRGKVGPDGSPIRLVQDPSDKNRLTDFPLHSLRVSLITALALDGGMSLPLLQKVVGHSRLLMTLYYIKPGAAHIMQEIDRACARLSALEEESIQKFLASATMEQLRDQAVFNDETSAFAALGKDSTTRNPAGWMPMHHGVCPMGGNTDAVPENKQLGGCHNGGTALARNGADWIFGPVPGGARNCVRCRWFITEPRYVPALVVHCNNLSYRYEQAQTLAIKRNEELEELKDRVYDAEKCDPVLARRLHTELLGTERRFETTLKDLEEAAQSMTACYSMIKRCIAIARTRWENGADTGGGMALVANGSDVECAVIVDGTDSELLQLSGVLEDAEIYPDVNPGEAIIRRSQLLDSALLRDSLAPRFFTLSREEQHLLGNEFIRRIGHECDPENSPAGRRMAVSMLENTNAGLSEQLGKSRQFIADLLPKSGEASRVFPIRVSNESVLASEQCSGVRP